MSPDPSIGEVSKSEWETLTTQEQDDIIASVEHLSATEWTQLARDRKADLIQDAIAERDTMYSGRMSRLPTLEGDADVFSKNLAAHKWTLAEGGEAQSESGEGGSVNYRGGGVEEYLDLTRYGQTAERHIAYDHSIAAVRSW